MPKLPDVPQVIRLRWIGTDAADLSVGSATHYRYNGAAPSSSQLTAIAPTWGNLWATNLAPLTDTGFTLTEIQIIDLSSSTAGQAAVTVSHPGTRAGAQLPLNVAATAGMITALRRRGGHWHSQVRAGVQTDLANPQQWTAAFNSAFTTGFLGFINGCAANLWSGATSMASVGVNYYGPPNVVRTSASGRVKTVSSLLPAPNVYPATAWEFPLRLGSQRRRLG